MSFFTAARCVLCAVLIASVTRDAHGQTATDSLFRRAKRLVAEGNGTAGRALVDSVLRSATEGTAGYGDALYWRGALAETAADAERDYRRVIVEYPLSQYVDQALLAMADLETARGDRAGALQHLQRFVKEHPANTPARGAAAFSAARLAFEQRDMRTGCAMVSAARASTPATNVEMRNQIDYLGSRCANVDLATTTAVVPQAANTASVPSPLPTPPVARDSTPRPTPKPSPTSATTTATAAPAAPAPVPVKKGTYTIQLAAYNTRAEAERLVAKLKAKGVEARVSGTAKPFRVRLDFYPTRQAAQDEVAALKARGIVGFVTTETPPPTGMP
jgi:cell division protein FtsN